MQNIYPYFSKNPLDRLDQTRFDDNLVESLKNSDDSLFLLFDGSNIIIDEKQRSYYFSRDDLRAYDINQKEIVLLGRYKDINYFALTLKQELKKNLSKVAIRDFVHLDFVKEDKLGIIAQGASLLNWHNLHKYCPKCGSLTLAKHAGWRRDCPSCCSEHFPKIDPVVIMLVTFGDFCLLGHGVNFKEKSYSCLAGFIESGESIEDASRRELYEEVGVRGLRVDYIASQPWPFPSTLMIGVHVVAKSQKLNLDTHEISDAKWIHKDDIRKILDGDESYGVNIPSKIAISRNLLEFWVK
jgi:NAD+ diphosphatase